MKCPRNSLTQARGAVTLTNLYLDRKEDVSIKTSVNDSSVERVFITLSSKWAVKSLQEPAAISVLRGHLHRPRLSVITAPPD